MAKSKSKSWPEIGSLRQRDEEGSKPYLVIHPSIKILVGSFNKDTKEYEDFTELDMGDYRTVKCVNPLAGIDALLDGGYIDEEEHEKKVNMVEEKNVVYKLTVPPSE